MTNDMVARVFARDLAECIRLSDARKRDNAARREQCRQDSGLVAHLETEAVQRGQRAIDWAEYFRNVGIND